MTIAHYNYLRMIVTSRGVLDFGDYHLIWDGNDWVVAAKADVQTILDRILANEGITEEDLHGNTTNKETLWLDTAKLGVHMNIGTKVWAENTTPAQPILAAAMHYQISDLDRGAIMDVLVKLNFIKGKVALIPVLDLPKVTITPLEITTFNQKIIDLTAAAPLFRIKQVVKNATKGDINADFTLLRAAKGKQDRLIHTYKLTQGTFVSAYDNGSKIIDLGKGATTAEAMLHPRGHVAWLHNEYLPGDTLTLRNHSILAKIKVFVSDTTDVPTTGGFELNPETEFKLEIPKDLNCPFGHYIIIVSMSDTDDAHVTGILAKGKSSSDAPAPPLV